MPPKLISPRNRVHANSPAFFVCLFFPSGGTGVGLDPPPQSRILWFYSAQATHEFSKKIQKNRVKIFFPAIFEGEFHQTNERISYSGLPGVCLPLCIRELTEAACLPGERRRGEVWGGPREGCAFFVATPQTTFGVGVAFPAIPFTAAPPCLGRRRPSPPLERHLGAFLAQGGGPSAPPLCVFLFGTLSFVVDQCSPWTVRLLKSLGSTQTTPNEWLHPPPPGLYGYRPKNPWVVGERMDPLTGWWEVGRGPNSFPGRCF